MRKARRIEDKISSWILRHPLFYVCRDIERAIGLVPNFPNYYIITNASPLAARLAKKYRQIILIKGRENLDTWELLQLPQTKKIISAQGGSALGGKPNILVFKNTSQIEGLCHKMGWKLLNPSAKLAGQVEEKISQIKWLGPLVKFLPSYKVTVCKKITWTGKKFILQFNRSHTGSGTILIASKKQLDEIKHKFPQREARVAEYISGPLFTNNNMVWSDKILLGNISYQITGLKPFTDLPFATIGNDWALPYKILSPEQIKQYNKIATEVGRRLKKSGWKGLFGIDVIMKQKTGRLYLLEINARQPASTTYESQLQSTVCHSDPEDSGEESLANRCTTFEAHLASLLSVSPDKYKLITIKNGAQIIQRITHKKISIRQLADKSQISNLTKKKFNIIIYNNTEPNSDLFRIQSKKGIMSAHNKLNKVGQAILCCL